MRSARILYKDEEAGVLIQLDDGSFEFRYHPHWVDDVSKPPINLTMPKINEAFRSEFLFPYFFNMLPEGINKQTVCYSSRIDENDHFGILMATAVADTIGAVRVVKIGSV